MGRDGGKFMKKSAPAKAPTPSEPPQMSVTQKMEKASAKTGKTEPQPKKGEW